jgi:ankyrin repeat protein
MSDPEEVVGAVTDGDLDRLKQLLARDAAGAHARAQNGVSALLLARYHSRLDLVELLRAARTDPLDVFEAAALGELERVRELLAADGSLSDARSPDEGTALHFACFFGHPDVARVLVAAGAPLDAVAPAFGAVHPLHSATASRVGETVALLLEAGAEPNARQAGGYTALHAAGKIGDADMVTSLLEHGADRTLLTDDGKTPADLALAEGHDALAQRLR